MGNARPTRLTELVNVMMTQCN